MRFLDVVYAVVSCKKSRFLGMHQDTRAIFENPHERFERFKLRVPTQRAEQMANSNELFFQNYALFNIYLFMSKQ
jgi:hypothetical protein